MATQTRERQRRGRVHAIDPDYLYTYEELSAVTGLAAWKIKREVQEGRMGYHQISEERGRRVEGQQYLDWKKARRRDPVE